MRRREHQHAQRQDRDGSQGGHSILRMTGRTIAAARRDVQWPPVALKAPVEFNMLRGNASACSGESLSPTSSGVAAGFADKYMRQT
jgi:hypothetical protein